MDCPQHSNKGIACRQQCNGISPKLTFWINKSMQDNIPMKLKIQKLQWSKYAKQEDDLLISCSKFLSFWLIKDTKLSRNYSYLPHHINFHFINTHNNLAGFQ